LAFSEVSSDLRLNTSRRYDRRSFKLDEARAATVFANDETTSGVFDQARFVGSFAALLAGVVPHIADGRPDSHVDSCSLELIAVPVEALKAVLHTIQGIAIYDEPLFH